MLGPAELARVQDGGCQQLLIMIDKVRLPNPSGDSREGRDPFVLSVLVRIRRWQNLEIHHNGMVGDWLYSIWASMDATTSTSVRTDLPPPSGRGPCPMLVGIFHRENAS
jgi:hypothetical protein